MKRLAMLLGILSLFLFLAGGQAQEPLPSWVSITPAQDCSQGCWRIVDAYYIGEEGSGGRHHLFGRTQDAQGNYIVAPFTLAWSDGDAQANTKLPPDWGDHALFGCFSPNEGEVGGYRAWAGDWESNADTIKGLGLPYCLHVSYYVTWKWQPANTTPTPTPAYRLRLPIILR